MKKTSNLLYVLLHVFISCGQSKNEDTSTNQDIYDFMQVVIKEQKLNLNYGLAINPESDFSVFGSDIDQLNSRLKDLVKKNSDSIVKNTDSLDFYYRPTKSMKIINLNELTNEDLLGMISQKERAKTFKWNNVGLGFNLSNKNNWYRFSVPLFSPDKNKVVMKIRRLCPGLCGEGKTILFFKKDGEWTSEMKMIWLH